MPEIFGHMRKFRDGMRRHELVSGPFVSLSDPYATEALIGSVDFLWFDMEHAPMSHEALGAHLIACRVKRVPAFVRVVGANGGEHLNWGADIKPLLDMGADGIIVPQVKTVEQVKDIVSDCRFPPAGRRGRGFLGGHFDYGRVDADQYMAEADAQVFVCIMLETKESLDAVEDIFRVPGLDSVCIGANDIMSSLGLPYPGTKHYGEKEHEVLMGAVKRAVAAAAAATAAGLGDKFVGFASGNVGYCAEAAACGAHWIQMGADRVMMKLKFEEMDAQMRQQRQVHSEQWQSRL